MKEMPLSIDHSFRWNRRDWYVRYRRGNAKPRLCVQGSDIAAGAVWKRLEALGISVRSVMRPRMWLTRTWWSSHPLSILIIRKSSRHVLI